MKNLPCKVGFSQFNGAYIGKMIKNEKKLLSHAKLGMEWTSFIGSVIIMDVLNLKAMIGIIANEKRL